MATENEKVETAKTQCPKVNCKCRRSVLTLLQSVENHVTNIVSSGPNLVQGTRITQTYKSALLSNILLEGKAVKGDEADLDISTEFEPVDTAKEHYIEHELMDRFDQQIVNTTRLRKTATKQVQRRMKHLIRPQLKYTALVSVQSEKHSDAESKPGCEEAIETQSGGEVTMETDTPVCHSTVNLDEVQARLQAVAEKSVHVRQNCEDMLQKSRDLSQALQVLKQSEKNELTKAIYDTPPSTPRDSSDIPGVHRDLPATKNISKKLLI